MTSIEPLRDTLGDRDVLNAAAKLAHQIAGTAFAPKAMQNKPEAVMGALLMGREIGLGPMASLSHIHVIDGKPCLDAVTQRALVLGAGHDMWVESASPTEATVAGKRRGSDNVQRITWTIDEAKSAGLANKENWRKYPRQMLVARATAELARLIAPDALGGVPYIVEEMIGDETTQPSRRGRQKTAPALPEGDVVDATVVDKPARPPLTDEQRFAMNLDLGADVRHALCEIAMGRTGARTADLDDDGRRAVQRWAGQLHRDELRLERLLSGPALVDTNTDQVVAYHDTTGPPDPEEAS